jgi:hypothetical protein
MLGLESSVETVIFVASSVLILAFSFDSKASYFFFYVIKILKKSSDFWVTFGDISGGDL